MTVFFQFSLQEIAKFNKIFLRSRLPFLLILQGCTIHPSPTPSVQTTIPFLVWSLLSPWENPSSCKLKLCFQFQYIELSRVTWKCGWFCYAIMYRFRKFNQSFHIESWETTSTLTSTFSQSLQLTPDTEMNSKNLKITYYLVKTNFYEFLHKWLEIGNFLDRVCRRKWPILY